MVYSSNAIGIIEDSTENVIINDILVVNLAEGRGPFATQLGAFNGYTADLALDGDIPSNAVETSPHCAQANGNTWRLCLVDDRTWAKNMSFTVSPFYSSDEILRYATAVVMKGHLVLSLYYGTLLKIILISCLCLNCVWLAQALAFSRSRILLDTSPYE